MKKLFKKIKNINLGLTFTVTNNIQDETLKISSTNSYIDGDPDILGLTTYTYDPDNGRSYQKKIVYSTKALHGSTKEALLHVVLHEVGHVLGLNILKKKVTI